MTSQHASQSSQNELERMFGVIEKAMTGAERMAELVDDPQMRKKLATALEKLAEVDQEIDLDLKTIRELQNVTDNVEEGKKFKDLFEELRSKTNKQTAGRYKKRIIEMSKTIRNPPKVKTKVTRGGRDDDDMEVMSITYSIKDPITKQDIKDPVKNTNCGHVYDRESVRAFIADCKNRKMLCQCPVRSCPNKKQLDMLNMAPFPEFFNQLNTEE
ncbi:zinc-finger of the MIZ type in nse subunit domain-containing protein [Ditylenchus destructor]|uniref:E3 SUMO-protein ligase NSE2 n=1 Tax=Ditylenchus destructor TaxID=166010 RepID=A0AAD4N5I3_9BILA|nr:zinc-finger of the MIZ type in nse subunit domain-containing protein [Ditylenchus destructor]